MRRVMRVLPRHGALSVVTMATHALRCTTATLVHNNNNNDADKTHASAAAAAVATSTAQQQQQQQLNGEHAKQTTTTTTTMTQCVKDAYEVTTRCNARGEAVSYTIRSPPSHIAAAVAAAAAQPSSSCAAGAVASNGTTSSAEHADANNDSGSSATATAATRTSAPHNSSTAATTTTASASAVHHAIFSEPIKRIILIRNGLSEADVNVSAFVTTPDWRIPLVEEGRRQCVDTGRALADLVGDEPVYFYYSPYIRARQSLRYVLQGYDERGAQRAHATRSAQQQPHDEEDDNNNNNDSSNNSNEDEQQQQRASSSLMSSARAPLSLASDTSQLVLRPDTFKRIAGVREDVRLRDADVGRYASTDELLHHMRERERYGLFFYRFPHGESGADVCDRVTGFLDAFQRERLGLPMNVNVVLLTHGLTIRMFVTRWFHLTVDTFHAMQSPPPASMCVLTRLHRQSRFRLDETSFDALRLPASLNACNGYRYRNKQLLGSMSIGAPYM